MSNTPTNSQPEQTVAEILKSLAMYLTSVEDKSPFETITEDKNALKEAEAALNRQALATALRLIGDDDGTHGAFGDLNEKFEYWNELRQELRQAFTDYYGGTE